MSLIMGLGHLTLLDVLMIHELFDLYLKHIVDAELTCCRNIKLVNSQTKWR
jgi:hypothetical protein